MVASKDPGWLLGELVDVTRLTNVVTIQCQRRKKMLDEKSEIHPLFENAPNTTEFRKLRKRIVRQVREAVEAYGMIERDAKWLVCLSGGKDSYTLLSI